MGKWGRAVSPRKELTKTVGLSGTTIEKECKEGSVGSHLNLYKKESKHQSKGPMIEYSKTEQEHFNNSTSSISIFSRFLA